MTTEFMEHSMQHWNGCQMCAIDIETSGLDPCFHEILQIAILPLTSGLEPRQDVVPFYMNFKPDYPERVDAKAMKINKLELTRLMREGIDKESAKDLLFEWIDRLKLPQNRSGYNRCKIIPLGHNYGAFDRGFITQWLGLDLYEEQFHYHHRDTMILLAYLNDKSAMHAEKVRFSQINLTALCNKMNVKRERSHDALQDCLATAECYRKLVSEGLLE